MSAPPFPELSEAERAALERGDAELGERVLTAMMNPMRGWLFRMLGPSAHLDDALQESLIEVAHALCRFRGGSSLKTFVHRITLRVAYRYFRQARVEREHEPLPVETSHDARVVERLSARQELDALYRLLDRLPESRRAAFVLCDVEGLSPREAAEVQGVSSMVLRARLARARADVRRHWSGEPVAAAVAGDPVEAP